MNSPRILQAHCQSPTSQRTTLSLSISVSSLLAGDRKESTIAQQCLKLLRGTVRHCEERSDHIRVSGGLVKIASVVPFDKLRVSPPSQ
jgi:hypothetical protein